MRAAWLRVVALPESKRVRSDRLSPAGGIAADTVRRLWMLAGNGLTAEMVGLGLGDLLGLLSSPRWLENGATMRARGLAFDLGRARWDEWAQPTGLAGGGDASLRGVPGGAAVSAVNLYRRVRGARPMGAELRATAPWAALASAADSWARAATPVIGLIATLSEARDPQGIANAQAAADAVRAEFADELDYLRTAEGQQSVRDVVVIDAQPAPLDQALPTIEGPARLPSLPERVVRLPRPSGPDLTAPEGANAQTGDGDMNEELIASSGLTADQIQQAADYNSGALRYRLTPAFEEYLAEERAALIALYQIEVFGPGDAVDGKYGPATDAKAEADRDAWLADPTRSDWGERWDAWLFWDAGPPAPDEPAPSPTPTPTPSPTPAPEPRAEVDPPSGGGGGGGVVPPVEPTPQPKPKKKGGGMLAWGLGLLGVGAIAIGAMTSGGKKRRKRRRGR